MLRGGFGLTEDASTAEGRPTAADGLVDMANDAWDEGLDLLGGPGAYHRWSLQDARGYLASGHPVVALVHARALPGHAPDEEDLDQPILLLGLTGDRFIYSDPSFASSLGYALEIASADLEAAWDQAATPRVAVAFARRPAPPARPAQPSAEQPTVGPLPSATATQEPTRAPTPGPTVEPTSGPTEQPLEEPPVEPVAARSPDVELANPDAAASAVQLAGAAASIAILALAALLRRHLPG
jgi:hypothetical protein